MRHFKRISGLSFRVPALLVAASTLARAGPWQPLTRTIAPDRSDMEGFRRSNVYIYTPVEKP